MSPQEISLRASILVEHLKQFMKTANGKVKTNGARFFGDDELYQVYKSVREQWHKWVIDAKNERGWKHVLKAYHCLELMVVERIDIPRGYRFEPVAKILELSDQIVKHMKRIANLLRKGELMLNENSL